MIAILIQIQIIYHKDITKYISLCAHYTVYESNESFHLLFSIILYKFP